MGVAVAANLGWAAVPASYYVKLDNDVEVLRADWLATLLQTAQSAPGIGCVGYYIDDAWPNVPQGAASFAVDYSVGSCILIPQATMSVWASGMKTMASMALKTQTSAQGLKRQGLEIFM